MGLLRWGELGVTRFRADFRLEMAMREELPAVKERLPDLAKLPVKDYLKKPLIRLRKDGPFLFVFRLPLYLLLLVGALAIKGFRICRAFGYVAWRFLRSPRSFLRRVIKLLRDQGPCALIRKLRQLSAVTLFPEEQYRIWLEKHRLTEEMLQRMKRDAVTFGYRPKISIVVPVHNTRREWLEKMIESVRNQVYENWELCLADDASTEPHVREVIEAYRRLDSRIKVVYRKKGGHISRASNSALKLATGEFVALLDHDDEITPDALYEVVKLLNEHPDADMIYSDEDKLELDGRRVDPHFKPDWSPDTFMSCMYTCHLGVYRKAIIDEIGGFRPGYEGAQDYDLVLRLTEKTDKIYHIPKILYHWRKVPGSTAVEVESKPYAIEAGRKALSNAVKRRGIRAKVLARSDITVYRVQREISGRPKVSIIIPTKDQVGLLKKCVKSIEKKTRYRNYEIVIVDNRSRKKTTKRYLESLPYTVLEFNEPFNFSRINNFAVGRTKGTHLLFLNNDTEVINEGWLEAMLEHSQREEVGAVGAKLLYPDKTVQHAGIVLGIGGVAGHSHKHFAAESPGYAHSLFIIRNYSAVTAACLMMRREAFEEVGGFEEELPRSFNDVDLCLKLREKGYLVVYTPFAQLYHYESATRPAVVDDSEVAYMYRKWGKILKNDPYYNPNLTLNSEDFGLKLEKPVATK